MLKALCLLTFSVAITFSDHSSMARPLTSNHPQYAAHSSRYRHVLADGGLLLFVDAFGKRTPIELEVTSTVGDLYEAASTALNLNMHRIELSFGQTVLSQEQFAMPLADAGLSSEESIGLNMLPNDIEMLLSTFADESDTMKEGINLQKIRAMNDELMRSGVEDISSVVQYINSLSNGGHSMHLDINQMRGRLAHIDDVVGDYGLITTPIGEHGGVREIKETVRVKSVMFGRFTDEVHFHWDRLPPQTVILSLGGGQSTTIDFSGIECRNLAEIAIYGMSELTQLELRGIEKCANLQTLWVAANPRLANINLEPLRACSKLRVLDITENALENLDVSPLVSITTLRKLIIAGNERLANINLEPLRGCAKLKALCLANNALEGLDVSPLVSITSLRKLIIFGNKFGEPGSESYENLVEPLRHLTEREDGLKIIGHDTL